MIYRKKRKLFKWFCSYYYYYYCCIYIKSKVCYKTLNLQLHLYFLLCISIILNYYYYGSVLAK
jgi:hypothetical protein